MQKTPGGVRLAVPDLIKEILTGSGDTEKAGARKKTTLGRLNSMVRMRISQFEGPLSPSSLRKQSAEKKSNN